MIERLLLVNPIYPFAWQAYQYLKVLGLG